MITGWQDFVFHPVISPPETFFMGIPPTGCAMGGIHSGLKVYSDMKYQPCIDDLSAIELPDELLALTELLAARTHEVWAAGRISEGWRYGEQRDDALKLHPCLVPYEELPESEREYDRKTSLETLKYVLSLGYEIKLRKEH